MGGLAKEFDFNHAAQGVRSQAHALHRLVGLVSRHIDCGGPQARREVVGKGRAVGHRHWPEIGVEDDDSFVGHLQRLPQGLNFGRLRWGPTVAAAPRWEAGTAGLGPQDHGFFDYCFN